LLSTLNSWQHNIFSDDSDMQNGGRLIDFQATQINFEAVLEIQEHA